MSDPKNPLDRLDRQELHWLTGILKDACRERLESESPVAAQGAQPWPDAVKYLREFSFHGVQVCSFRKLPGPVRPLI